MEEVCYPMKGGLGILANKILSKYAFIWASFWHIVVNISSFFPLYLDEYFFDLTKLSTAQVSWGAGDIAVHCYFRTTLQYSSKSFTLILTHPHNVQKYGEILFEVSIEHSKRF